MMHCDMNPYVMRWLTIVENEEFAVCRDQKRLAAYVRRCFESEEIYTDDELMDRYIGLGKYFPFERLFDWEPFCLALHLCTFWKDTGMPRWPDLLLLIGRGAGKDGYIALESLCVTSPYSGLDQYDVDICAMSAEQSVRPVKDIVIAMDRPEHRGKLKKYYYWTMETVRGLKYGGVVRGRTNNPGSKDGMRSGMVVFNEIHQYKNFENLKVFISGLGKKKHPRRLYATTNGDTREGPLDDLLKKAEGILGGELDDNGLLPFICRLDDKEEAKNPEMWPKANPSLPYLPSLLSEIHKEFLEWTENPDFNTDFMTKRMNLPQGAADTMVTDYENVKATNRPLPDMLGWECVCGIDYASISDFASVNLHFRRGDERYDIGHAWLCLQSKDLHRISAPWREWASAGKLTLVDDVEINPEWLCRWIEEKAQMYTIKKIAIDGFRYALMTRSLQAIGFDANERKNIKLVRPSDIMKAAPVIDSVFTNRRFTWGDNPPLRWAVNNTKLVRSSKKEGSDTGNFYYAKIEAKSRKTDPFMALVAAMTIEDELTGSTCEWYDLPVIM